MGYPATASKVGILGEVGTHLSRVWGQVIVRFQFFIGTIANWPDFLAFSEIFKIPLTFFDQSAISPMVIA